MSKITYIKPGQLITINNVVYRAYKKTVGCIGCDLCDILLCPCIKDLRFGPLGNRYNCAMYGVILKRINTHHY